MKHLIVILSFLLLLSFPAEARKKASGVSRDSRGHIKRSSIAKKQFMKQTGYPKGRPGYVVDHKTPLYKGGKDSPDNMQWQAASEAKAKDKWE